MVSPGRFGAKDATSDSSAGPSPLIPIHPARQRRFNRGPLHSDVAGPRDCPFEMWKPSAALQGLADGLKRTLSQKVVRYK